MSDMMSEAVIVGDVVKETREEAGVSVGCSK
jgi:hypothetical protein